ncbi:MAG: YibE/F family protein [Deltaproteobacteria bacterium]|nr:YibE/F family protein [Deltaproteobacteria bacterium]
MKKFITRDIAFVAAVLLIPAGLFLFVGPQKHKRVTVYARIIGIEDNTEIMGTYLKVGEQKVTACVLRGPFQGRKIIVDNDLVGNLMLDRFIEVGDRAIFSLDLEEGVIREAELVDFDRQSWHLIMFVIFAMLLILFARHTGVKALVSFIFTVAVLVKILLPAVLKGYDPLLLCLSLAGLVASVTLLLVSGFSIRTLAAMVGVMIGMVLAAGLTVLAGKGIRLEGMASEHSLILLFSGYPYLNLDRIFWGAVILGASGAMVDVAIAIATAVEQVVKANPSLGARKLIQSGFEVGRAALGTMVTTLLLAYAGCSLFLLLVFDAKETHLARILNYNFVSAEILRILAGSIGMLMVAPITAVIAGVLYHRIYGSKVRIENSYRLEDVN